MNVVRRACAALIAAAAIVSLSAVTASAHAVLQRSEPAGGANLASPPSQVILTFTEPPDPALSRVRVFDVSGRTVGSGRSTVAGPNVVRTPIGVLSKGVYTVSWRVVSRTDGHVTAGAFAFGVGVSPEGVAPPAATALPETKPPAPLAVAGRFFLYWGLALMLGGAVAALRLFDRAFPVSPRWLVVPWVFAVGGVIAITLAERSAIGVSLGTLLSSSIGTAIIREAIGLVLAGLSIAFVVKTKKGFLLVALATAIAMMMHALSGHAAASEGRAINLTVQWLHLCAVAIWIGGLAWLLVGLRRGGSARLDAVVKYSRVAGVALAVVVATGSLRALGEVGSIRGLFNTSFGVTLLVKMSAFLPLVALGAINRFVIVPRINRGDHSTKPIARTIAAEVALAAVMFGATGVLVGLPPSSSIAAASKPVASGLVIDGQDFATSVRARLTVTPGGAGPNRFAVTVSDFDSGVAVAARRVALSFTLPARPDIAVTQLELVRRDDGVWFASGTNLSIRGKWHIDLLVERGSGSVTVPFDVQTQAPPARLSVQPGSGPGQPTLYTLTFEDDSSVQVYTDPERPGRAEVHFTFFTKSGGELAVPTISITARSPVGASTTPKLVRLSPGHVSAPVELTVGKWIFDIEGSTDAGVAVSTSLTISIA